MARPLRMNARRLALAGIIGPAVFGVASIVGGFVEDPYSPVHNYISQLAATGSSFRTPMRLAFFALGLCILVFAFALHKLRAAAVMLAFVVALSGAGTLMAGTFTCDPRCPTKGETTTHQDLHNVSAIITFSSWIVAPFVAAWQLRRSRSSIARVSLALGLVELAVGLALGSYADARPDDPVGLLQRMELLAIGVWFLMLTLDLRRVSPAQ